MRFTSYRPLWLSCQHFFSILTGQTGWRRQAVAFALGAVLSFALAPFLLFFIPFFVFPSLFAILNQIAAKTEGHFKKRLTLFALTGWSFGFGYFVFGLWWIGHALLVGGTAFLWLMPFTILGIPAFLALYYGLACLIVSFSWRYDWAKILLFSLAFGFCEWARAILFTGFPWNALGYLLVPFPIFMQIVPFLGLYGLNLIAVFIFSLPMFFFSPQTRSYALFWFLGFFIITLGWGSFRLFTAPSLEQEQQNNQFIVRLVQPSIPQTNKWDEAYRETILNSYIQLSQSPNTENLIPQIIIWPETAIPYIVFEHSPLLKTIGSILKPEQILLSGALRATFTPPDQTHVFNSIIMINAQGTLLDYNDKNHLVPFGEYIPLSSLLNRLNIQKLVYIPNGFSAGHQHRELKLPSGQELLPLICYEAIFPESGAGNLKNSSAILNVSNDAWYGNTPGPYQHFFQARIHGVATGLPLIRAANNGISAVTDGYGRIVKILPYSQIGIIDVAVPNAISLPLNVVIINQTFLVLSLIFLIAFFIILQKNAKIK